MNGDNLHKKVTQLCISGLLSCLRSSTIAGVDISNFSNVEMMNMEMLRFYWALTNSIEEIANLVVYSPRRLTTTITYEENERIGEITGSVNASATMLAQARTLNPTLFVILEPRDTSLSQSNYLVAWTLYEAFQILMSARRSYKQLDKYEWFNRKITLIEIALRNESLHEILLTSTKRRPNSSVLRAASKTRTEIYQKSIEVYNLLEEIESRDERAILTCLSQTLIPKLEYWQQLELSTALAAANALSHVTKFPVNLLFPIESGRPLATIGSYEVYWQYNIPQRSRNQLDPTELWSRQITTSIGISSSDSRADIIIRRNQKVVSIIECKYFESISSLSQAVIDASGQIVRYSRDLYPESDPLATQLISNSCIVVSDRGFYNEILNRLNFDEQSFDKRFIYFTDIDGLINSSLLCWAIHLDYDFNH